MRIGAAEINVAFTGPGEARNVWNTAQNEFNNGGWPGQEKQQQRSRHDSRKSAHLNKDLDRSVPKTMTLSTINLSTQMDKIDRLKHIKE